MSLNRILSIIALTSLGVGAYIGYLALEKYETQEFDEKAAELRALERQLERQEDALNRRQEQQLALRRKALAMRERELAEEKLEERNEADQLDSDDRGDSLVDGRLSPSSATFRTVPSQYSTKSVVVHRDMYSNLMLMLNAARKDGIPLTVVSGFRSYHHQRNIWQRKWHDLSPSMSEAARVKSIMRFSSLPGISRHHWGSDIDFNDVSPSYWQTAKGKEILAWLRKNAPRFGFCEVYAGKSSGKRQGGYEDEPWHWSYLKVAKPLQAERLATLDNVLNRSIEGQNAIRENKAEIQRYITSISPACR